MSLERVDSVDPTEVYDYIICGGGTSGCVIAGRLATNLSAKILILEAGPDNADLENVHMAGGWSKNFDSETDWNIVTEPMPGVNNRRVNCSRGRLLGGSSGVNGTLCIRGTKEDYDDWGMEEWTGDKMWEYMKKSETFHPKDWHAHDSSAHGTSGHLHTEPHDLAPISERMKQSMIDAGLPYHADMFSTGESPHGCGNVTRTVHRGIRSTAADFVTKSQRSDHITIKTAVTVDKILFTPDSDDVPRATSVATISKDGIGKIYEARREIIITAGAYCSPPILMRSGIGPKEQLKQHDIPVLVDSPQVGQNLQDHLLVFQFYEVSEPGLTNDHLVYHDNAIASSYQLYKDKKEGVLSTFPFGIFGYARLDERLNNTSIWKLDADGRDPMGLTKAQPNLEFWNTELYGGPKQFADFPIDKKHAFAMCTLLFNPHSRGSVKLASANPLDNPIVDHGYLSDPDGLDMLVLSEGCAMANEFVTAGSGTKDIVKGAWPAHLTHHKHTKRQDWEEHVREHATTCYHASGTCAMGSVLDSRLRVKGVGGLRVADVSSIPRVNNGHTQMVAYGIGEGCAEMVCEEAKGRDGMGHEEGSEFLKLAPEMHKMKV